MGCFKSKQEVSQEDLNFLKTHTNFDKNTINEWFKNFKKECPDGQLSPPNFTKLYKKCFPHCNAEKICEHVFRSFDTDNNNFIDFREFMLAIYITSAGTAEEKLKWTFRIYDVDGNGVINQGEMINIVQAIDDMLGVDKVRLTDAVEVRARNIFNRMDENKDGNLTEEEFLKGCLQDKELSKILASNAEIK